MMAVRVDRSTLAAFDALAEGRGGRSALLRSMLDQAMQNVTGAPLVAARSDSANGRVSIRLTSAEMAVVDHRPRHAAPIELAGSKRWCVVTSA
ncbi:hypothetical protein [Sphingomonas yabuuchiae]|uniref:hypothetical protein n=1 Tax=Sphingomonas yabuuchiae TaxID=172044 RepID=UPI00361286CE